ncbi:substrate binding domain-containing protein [Pandoraea sp. NPDC087047]|uniref:substrate binding domain-containing protein n=1 Tax=Pandoraea sp. NPDC087047 TaxID=3364390 RepID=UPI00381EF5B0
MVVVAHPNYLKRAGTPKTPDDLAAHECIEFDLPSTGRPIPWLFRAAGEDIEFLARGSFRRADDVLGGVTLAKAGGGIFQTYRFNVEEDLASGRLVEVLPDYAGRSRPVSLVYPHGKTLPSRARAFVDFLMQTLAHSSEPRKSVVRAPEVPVDTRSD